MKQVFIVMEGNGESYEDYMAFSIAAFSSKEDADNYAIQLQKEYDDKQNKAALLEDACQQDSDSLHTANPYSWGDDEYSDVCTAIYEYLGVKYPGVAQMDYSRHSFFVSEPVPFIQ